MTEKQLREREMALATIRECPKAPIPSENAAEWPMEKKEQAIVLLRACGAKYDTIMQELDISRGKIASTLQKQENQELMSLIREVTKVEMVANGLSIQRKLLDAIRYLPATAGNASAIRNLAAAAATIYDKSALAAGEATERTESRSITINLDEKRARYEQLLASRELREGRIPTLLSGDLG